jgi:hypothetical protein
LQTAHHEGARGQFMFYQRMFPRAMFRGNHRPVAINRGRVFGGTISGTANLKQGLNATAIGDPILGLDRQPQVGPGFS